MLNLSDLEQLVLFADGGTLAAVAEQTHISTPSVTRTMQRLEEEFGVPLFIRGKNRIALNQTGELAASRARTLLASAAQTVQDVQAYDRSLRTITIQSCAPAPLWELLRSLQTAHPGMTIASSIGGLDETTAAMDRGACDYAILPYEMSHPQYTCREFMHENLYVCVPKDHDLASHETLSSADINGFNFLLRSELGFWDALCRRDLPASRFLVQTDEADFAELVRSSSLPCFVTDYTSGQSHIPEGRVAIPLTDDSVHVTFYLYERN